MKGVRHGACGLLGLGLILTSVPAAIGGGARITLDLTAQALPATSDLVLLGRNDAAAPRTVVIRIDDQPDPDYAHRANVERTVPPGPFTIRLRLGDLRTPRGVALSIPMLRRALAFGPDAGLHLDALSVEQPASLPDGTMGWFFGPAYAVPLRGFHSVDPSDPALSGPAVRLMQRVSQDPLLRWGMRFTRFETHLPSGRWHLTLWTEDPGEWETLPAVLERRIRVNGADIVLERRSEEEWVRTRYLAGRDHEADPDHPPWEALGARRGGRVDADVTLDDGRLVLELAGHPQAATHLAAMVASPASDPDRAVRAVEAERARRFAEAWPQAVAPPHAAEVRDWTVTGSDRAIVIPGGHAVLRWMVQAPEDAEFALLVDRPAVGLWGQWRWTRATPEATNLSLLPRIWRRDIERIPIRKGLPRPIALIIPIPADASPAEHIVPISMQAGSRTIRRDVRIVVVRAQQAGTASRVGVFLDFAPHLAFSVADARRQAACDMDTLRSLGLTALAPPLSTPSDNLEAFQADLRAAAARFAPPLIAYAPARRMQAASGAANAAGWIARANAAARAAGLPTPIWTVADEPSAAGTTDLAVDLIRRARLADRESQFAGFLNDPSDRRISQQLDLVAVNPRFGLDTATVAAMSARGQSIWLYNMPHPRLGAGFQAWALGAVGLMQWHARMPTADPFDPTDGREGDVQFLWPTLQVCGPADLDDDLLELVAGAEDARWLTWLDQRVQDGNPKAKTLQRTLREAVNQTLSETASQSRFDPDLWRARIAALARNLIQ